MSLSAIKSVLAGHSGVTLMARIRGAAGVLITQASFSSITWAITNLTSATAVNTGTFTVSSTVYDSLQQNDPRWRRDSAAQPGVDGTHGFNFLGTIGRANFAAQSVTAGGVTNPGPRWQADVIFTPVSGEAFIVSYIFSTQPVFA